MSGPTKQPRLDLGLSDTSLVLDRSSEIGQMILQGLLEGRTERNDSLGPGLPRPPPTTYNPHLQSLDRMNFTTAGLQTFNARVRQQTLLRILDDLLGNRGINAPIERGQYAPYAPILTPRQEQQLATLPDSLLREMVMRGERVSASAVAMFKELERLEKAEKEEDDSKDTNEFRTQIANAGLATEIGDLRRVKLFVIETKYLRSGSAASLLSPEDEERLGEIHKVLFLSNIPLDVKEKMWLLSLAVSRAKTTEALDEIFDGLVRKVDSGEFALAVQNGNSMQWNDAALWNRLTVAQLERLFSPEQMKTVPNFPLDRMLYSLRHNQRIPPEYAEEYEKRFFK